MSLVISSLDKNFLVPVGGALIYGRDTTLIERVGKMYPGRAGSYYLIDLLITLLSLGRPGWL